MRCFGEDQSTPQSEHVRREWHKAMALADMGVVKEELRDPDDEFQVESCKWLQIWQRDLITLNEVIAQRVEGIISTPAKTSLFRTNVSGYNMRIASSRCSGDLEDKESMREDGKLYVSQKNWYVSSLLLVTEKTHQAFARLL